MVRKFMVTLLRMKMKLAKIRKLVQDLANYNTMSGQVSMDRKLTSTKIRNHIILIMNAIKEAEESLEMSMAIIEELTEDEEDYELPRKD